VPSFTISAVLCEYLCAPLHNTTKIYKKQGGWVFLRTEDRRQRTEDRGQRTEDRGQRTEHIACICSLNTA